MSVLQHNASNRETAARTTGSLVVLLCVSLAMCGCIERNPKSDFTFHTKAELEDATKHAKTNNDDILPCKVVEDCHIHPIDQCWEWVCETWEGVKQCAQSSLNDTPCSDPDKCIDDGQGKCSSDGQCIGPSCPSSQQCEDQVCTDKHTDPNN